MARILAAAFNKKIADELQGRIAANPTAATLDRKWTIQQEAIFAAMTETRAHRIVRARAGTGKTTTIIEGIRRMSGDAEAKTLHGVGYACVRRFWEGLRIDDKRADKLAQAVCGDQAPDAIKRLVRTLVTKAREITPHAKTAGSLVDVAIEFECLPDQEWSEAGFDLAYVEARTLEAMELAATKRPGEGIDFADMLYLPVRNGWLFPVYDDVIVDEAQDMTVTQLEIAQGVCKGRIVVVGDDRQAIYAFRGADSDSLDRLKGELNAEESGLTTTYRCGKNIVREAQTLVADIEAASTNGDGSIETMQTIAQMVAASDPKAGDFILSRSNAPLAKVAMAHIRAQKPVKIQGRDIAAGLKSLTRQLMKGAAAHSIPKFLEKLVVWEARECDRLIKMDREERTDAIHDKADTLRVLTDGVQGPRELEARLDTLFSDDPSRGAVICSSVHKAKGLESDRVFVLRPTLYPKAPKGKVFTAKRIKEEQNIHYVAVTRAKESLVYVDEK